MCLPLPDVLISLVGIEKVFPRYRDMEVFLQTLPRSATGERMNPYNSSGPAFIPEMAPKISTLFCWTMGAEAQRDIARTNIF